MPPPLHVRFGVRSAPADRPSPMQGPSAEPLRWCLGVPGPRDAPQARRLPAAGPAPQRRRPDVVGAGDVAGSHRPTEGHTMTVTTVTPVTAVTGDVEYEAALERLRAYRQQLDRADEQADAG